MLAPDDKTVLAIGLVAAGLLGAPLSLMPSGRAERPGWSAVTARVVGVLCSVFLLHTLGVHVALSKP